MITYKRALVSLDCFDGYVYSTKTLEATFDNFVTGIGYDYYAVDRNTQYQVKLILRCNLSLSYLLMMLCMDLTCSEIFPSDLTG